MEIVHKNCVLRSLYSMQFTGVLEFITIVSNLCIERALGLNGMLCYIPHEQILLRRWSRLHHKPALRQMLPHLWGSNSLYVFLTVSWGCGGSWWMINIWHFAVYEPKFWLLYSSLIYYHYKRLCVCLCVYTQTSRSPLFLRKWDNIVTLMIWMLNFFAYIDIILLMIQIDCLILPLHVDSENYLAKH